MREHSSVSTLSTRIEHFLLFPVNFKFMYNSNQFTPVAQRDGNLESDRTFIKP